MKKVRNCARITNEDKIKVMGCIMKRTRVTKRIKEKSFLCRKQEYTLGNSDN